MRVTSCRSVCRGGSRFILEQAEIFLLAVNLDQRLPFPTGPVPTHTLEDRKTARALFLVGYVLRSSRSTKIFNSIVVRVEIDVVDDWRNRIPSDESPYNPMSKEGLPPYQHLSVSTLIDVTGDSPGHAGAARHLADQVACSCIVRKLPMKFLERHFCDRVFQSTAPSLEVWRRLGDSTPRSSAPKIFAIESGRG